MTRNERPGLSIMVRETMRDLVDLLDEHGKLLRAELVEEVRRAGWQAVVLALFGALSVVGYGFVVMAAALWLASAWLPLPWALMFLGGLHILGSIIGLLVIVRSRQRGGQPSPSRQELEISVAILSQAVQSDTRPAPRDRPAVVTNAH